MGLPYSAMYGDNDDSPLDEGSARNERQIVGG
jgi:hypothetical protein